MADLGFIGLGKMGIHMARNLLKAGHRVTVCNRSQGPVDTLAGEGAERAANPAEAARQSRVLFTCLSTPAVLEEIVRQALEGSQPGDIYLDHSTIGASDARKMAALCAERSVKFLDAPVSGGPWGAEAGTLSIMCGGETEAYEQVLPYLKVEGKQLYHLGPVGAGSVAKACNQLLVGIHTAATAEAFVLGVKAGLDPRVLLEVIGGATGHSKQMERNLTRFTFPGNFDAAFSVEFLHKDVGIAVNLGKENHVRMVLGALTLQLLEEARAAGYAEKDVSALIRPLEQLSGVEVRAGS